MTIEHTKLKARVKHLLFLLEYVEWDSWLGDTEAEDIEQAVKDVEELVTEGL